MLVELAQKKNDGFYAENIVNLSYLLFLSGIPRRVVNKLLNLSARGIGLGLVHVDWFDLKVINPKFISIGQNFSSGRGLWMESVGNGHVIIGDNVNISDWVHIAASYRVEIGHGVLIGSKVIITDHSHGHIFHDPIQAAEINNLRPADRPIVSKGPVSIGENTWIGDGVVVLAGVTIGKNCIIGANAVVTKDIADYSIVVGRAAQPINR